MARPMLGLPVHLVGIMTRARELRCLGRIGIRSGGISAP